VVVGTTVVTCAVDLLWCWYACGKRWKCAFDGFARRSIMRIALSVMSARDMTPVLWGFMMSRFVWTGLRRVFGVCAVFVTKMFCEEVEICI